MGFTQIVRDYLKGIVDDSVKGILRSIGDAGATPSNSTGFTALSFLNTIKSAAHSHTISRSQYASSTGAVLSLTINCVAYEGRHVIEIWVKSSAAATFTVQGSRNDTDYRDVDSIVLAAIGEDHKVYINAYAYIKVSTTAANDNEIEIVSSS